MKAEATLKALDESRAEPQKEERKQQKGRSRDMDMDR